MTTPRITIDPKIRQGRPCVAGTRIPVHAVLQLLEDGASLEEITRDFYPDLTNEDIKACIHYANQLVKNEEVHISVG